MKMNRKKTEQQKTEIPPTESKNTTSDSASAMHTQNQQEQQLISAMAQLRDANIMVLNDYHIGDVDTLNDEQRYAALQQVRVGLFLRGTERKKYLHEAVIPLCKVIIAKFPKEPRVSKGRLNNAPTLEELFQSVGLSLNTVYSWIRRDKDPTLGLEEFYPDKPKVLSQREKERTYIHGLVKAVKEGDKEARLAAAKAVEDIIPAPQQPKQDALPPIDELPLPRLALALVREVEAFFNVSKLPKPLAVAVSKLKAELHVVDAAPAPQEADTEKAA